MKHACAAATCWLVMTIGCSPADSAIRDDVAAQSAAAADRSALSVTVADSILLAESDTAFVAVPSSIAIAPDGRIAITDGQSRRVFLFGRDGALRQVVGRQGKGPGEFSSPSGIAFVDDSLMVVDDAGAQQLHMFRYPEGSFVRSVRRGGTALTMNTSGNSVWLGILRMRSNTAVTEWNVSMDTVRYHGEVPEQHRASPRIGQVYGYVAATATPEAIYYAAVSDTAVRRVDRSTGATSSIPVPRRARRGVPADLGPRLERTTAAEDYASMLSSLVAINVPSRDTIQTVHFDVTFADDVITAQGYLTTLDTRTGRGCVDASLGFTGDARPQVTFVGDTLVTVDQAVVGQQGLTFVRLLLPPPRC